MPEFFGTDFQIALQKRMIARHVWIADMPEIANGGRVMNILDPKAIGWERVKSYVDEDGTVALTAMARRGAIKRLGKIFGEGYDFPMWDVQISPANQVLARCHQILAKSAIGEGWSLDCLERPHETELEAIQSLNLATGVAPLPGPYLRSEIVPSFTSCLWTPDGALAAVSNVTARYHLKSRFARHVFNGSTSVDSDHRGSGLGKIVTAHALVQSHRKLGWTHALAQVAPDNAPSHRMVEACGMTKEPSIATFGVIARGVTFTR